MSKRVFNLSVHRSGTKSFVDLCSRNGLRCLHWPGVGFDLLCRPAVAGLDTRYLWSLYDYISDTYQGFADLPCPLVYREAMTQVPDADFLLVTRSPQDWVASVRKHTARRWLDALEAFQYGLLCGRVVRQLAALSDEQLQRGYIAFNERVAVFAAERKVRFATFELEDPGIGAKLAEFIGLPKTAEFRRVDWAGESKAWDAQPSAGTQAAS